MRPLVLLRTRKVFLVLKFVESKAYVTITKPIVSVLAEGCCVSLLHVFGIEITYVAVKSSLKRKLG